MTIDKSSKDQISNAAAFSWVNDYLAGMDNLGNDQGESRMDASAHSPTAVVA
jgi:hypothetical protein